MSTRKIFQEYKVKFWKLNVLGCKEVHQRKKLAKDALAFDIDILRLSQGLQNIQTSKVYKQTNTLSFQNYLLFHTGSNKNKFHSVSLLINKDLNLNFEKVSARQQTKLELREGFYDQVDRVISKVGSRNIVVMVGDLNAKTGSGWREFDKNMGKYGKVHINSSGRFLLELL